MSPRSFCLRVSGGGCSFGVEPHSPECARSLPQATVSRAPWAGCDARSRGVMQRLFLLAVAGIVFEGDLELGTESFDLPVLDDEILLDDFGNAEIAQAARRELDRGSRCFLPRLLAGPDQFQDLIDAVCHTCLPMPGVRRMPGRTQAPDGPWKRWNARTE